MSTPAAPFKVGDAVQLRDDLYEGPDDYSPGGYFARGGEKLIVREVRDSGRWPLSVSHEWRTDGITFGVGVNEVFKYTEMNLTPSDTPPSQQKEPTE